MSRADADKLLTDLTQMITAQSFEGLDVEAYLDERDETGFADEWMQAYHKLVNASETNEEEIVRACREQTYKQTLTYTGNSELAGYVSDDMGLIGAYLLQDSVKDSFVDQLFESYKKGTLPLR